MDLCSFVLFSSPKPTCNTLFFPFHNSLCSLTMLRLHFRIFSVLCRQKRKTSRVLFASFLFTNSKNSSFVVSNEWSVSVKVLEHFSLNFLSLIIIYTCSIGQCSQRYSHMQNFSIVHVPWPYLFQPAFLVMRIILFALFFSDKVFTTFRIILSPYTLPFCNCSIRFIPVSSISHRTTSISKTCVQIAKGHSLLLMLLRFALAFYQKVMIAQHRLFSILFSINMVGYVVPQSVCIGKWDKTLHVSNSKFILRFVHVSFI